MKAPLPLFYRYYFEAHKACYFCGQDLRASMHAFNHFHRFHADSAAEIHPQQNQTQSYYVWLADNWAEVSLLSYLFAQTLGIATATARKKAA